VKASNTKPLRLACQPEECVSVHGRAEECDRLRRGALIRAVFGGAVDLRLMWCAAADQPMGCLSRPLNGCFEVDQQAEAEAGRSPVPFRYGCSLLGGGERKISSSPRQRSKSTSCDRRAVLITFFLSSSCSFFRFSRYNAELPAPPLRPTGMLGSSTARTVGPALSYSFHFDPAFTPR
jgi:hypothetical protein